MIYLLLGFDYFMSCFMLRFVYSYDLIIYVVLICLLL